MTGTIFDIKEMAVHDGPGIRTTVFLKGCPLRCKWCHNPEGFTIEPQLLYKEARCLKCGRCTERYAAGCGHEDCQSFGRCLHVCPQNCLIVTGRNVMAKELAAELLQSAQVLGDTFGGFTFSGGEPLMQAEFLLELMELLKDYHLCMETSGCADTNTFQKVIAKLDFVIMDIKLADTEAHKRFTGSGNEQILKNFELLRSIKKPYIIRTPLIPGITDTPQNLDAIGNIIGNSTWEKLPYNTMAGAKYKMLGLPYKLL